MNPNFSLPCNTLKSGGDSYYNSLQVVLNKRIGHGLEFQSAYAMSSAEPRTATASNMDGNDCGSGGATGFDPLNPQNDKGPGCSDVRNNWRIQFACITRRQYQIERTCCQASQRLVDGEHSFRPGRVSLLSPTLTSNRSVSGVFNGLTGQGDRPKHRDSCDCWTRYRRQERLNQLEYGNLGSPTIPEIPLFLELLQIGTTP